jgi:hypothetical protein
LQVSQVHSKHFVPEHCTITKENSIDKKYW